MWVDPDDEGHVHAVIWWSSREEWKRITPEQVEAIDRRMGPIFREPVVREFRVVAG